MSLRERLEWKLNKITLKCQSFPIPGKGRCHLTGKHLTGNSWASTGSPGAKCIYEWLGVQRGPVIVAKSDIFVCSDFYLDISDTYEVIENKIMYTWGPTTQLNK